MITTQDAKVLHQVSLDLCKAAESLRAGGFGKAAEVVRTGALNVSQAAKMVYESQCAYERFATQIDIPGALS